MKFKIYNQNYTSSKTGEKKTISKISLEVVEGLEYELQIRGDVATIQQFQKVISSPLGGNLAQRLDNGEVVYFEELGVYHE